MELGTRNSELGTPIAVLGAGSWGTTLAIGMAGTGHAVRLWDHRPERAAEMNRRRENAAYLPGFPFPPTLLAEADLERATGGAEIVVVAVPAQTMRAFARRMAPHVVQAAAIVSAAKGLDSGTLQRMTEALAAEAPALAGRLAALSGPNLAIEIAQGHPAATVVAAAKPAVAVAAQRALAFRNFRVYTSADVIGVELGGALKNVMALAAGMCDGLDLGDNARASLLTRGLAEITRLGVAMGARPLTFAGLSGLGDLVATATSAKSRNYRTGLGLAQGRPLAEVLAGLHGVAEGVETTRAVLELAARHGVHVPISAQVHHVLFEGQSPRQAAFELMSHELKEE